jgi:hypothetical protein
LRYPSQVLVREVRCCNPGSHSSATKHTLSKSGFP